MSLQPVNVAVQERTLELTWSDGHRSIYDNKFLRESCSCAACQGEPLLFGKGYIPLRPQIPDDVKPVRIGQVGRYAIRIEWSDRHSSGIYTFNHLRSICQCEECKTKDSK